MNDKYDTLQIMQGLWQDLLIYSDHNVWLQQAADLLGQGVKAASWGRWTSAHKYVCDAADKAWGMDLHDLDHRFRQVEARVYSHVIVGE